VDLNSATASPSVSTDLRVMSPPGTPDFPTSLNTREYWTFIKVMINSTKKPIFKNNEI